MPVRSSFVRDGRPGVLSSFVVAAVGFIQFTLGSFYADCPHKRIIMKVYMERKNMQLELIRFC